MAASLWSDPAGDQTHSQASTHSQAYTPPLDHQAADHSTEWNPNAHALLTEPSLQAGAVQCRHQWFYPLCWLSLLCDGRFTERRQNLTERTAALSKVPNLLRELFRVLPLITAHSRGQGALLAFSRLHVISNWMWDEDATLSWCNCIHVLQFSSCFFQTCALPASSEDMIPVQTLQTGNCSVLTHWKRKTICAWSKVTANYIYFPPAISLANVMLTNKHYKHYKLNITHDASKKFVKPFV